MPSQPTLTTSTFTTIFLQLYFHRRRLIRPHLVFATINYSLHLRLFGPCMCSHQPMVVSHLMQRLHRKTSRISKLPLQWRIRPAILLASKNRRKKWLKKKINKEENHATDKFEMKASSLFLQLISLNIAIKITTNLLWCNNWVILGYLKLWWAHIVYPHATDRVGRVKDVHKTFRYVPHESWSSQRLTGW